MLIRAEAKNDVTYLDKLGGVRKISSGLLFLVALREDCALVMNKDNSVLLYQDLDSFYKDFEIKEM